MGDLLATGYKLYLTTNIAADTTIQSTAVAVSKTPPTNMIHTQGMRGARIIALGSDAGLVAITVYGVDTIGNPHQPDAYITTSWGVYSVTFAADDAILPDNMPGELSEVSTYLMGGDITTAWAVTTGTNTTGRLNYTNGGVFSADGASTAACYSELFISDFGNAYGLTFGFDINVTAPITGVNLLIALDI